MILPSTHRSFSDKEPRPIDWRLLLHYIRDPNSSVRRDTELSRDARARGDKDEADRLKRACGAFAPSTQMVGGHDGSQIVAFTQCCICDVDHIKPEDMPDVVARAIHDQHTLLQYTTNSQLGLRVIFRWIAVDEEGEVIPESFFTWDGKEPQATWLERIRPYHNAAFALGNAYYSLLLGYKWDSQTSDPNRLSLYAHDPDAYLNEDAVPFVITKKQTLPHRPSPALPVREGDAIRLGRRQRLATHTSKLITHNSPFDLAEKWVSEKVQYVKGSYNRHVMLVAYKLAKLGVSEAEATAWAVRQYSDYNEKAVKAIVKSCYRRANLREIY